MPQKVIVRRESVVLPTYEPCRPDPNPMFLEKRVYQGSSGRVYPLPVIDRISERPRPHRWQAIFLENKFLRVMLLPELGGRIHRLVDKTNGYDAIYYQPVIKPALVGLTGPWCSGGIEFNWPQHHRPSTYLPTDVAVERHPDGSATVWMSEHDPMARMKGMHGVRLHPGRSFVELRARAYNRTPDVQTFLWWANVATAVHEEYQSFFPPDATHVADHAKRATTTFPHANGTYYGVDYRQRGKTGIPPGERPAQFVPPHWRTPSEPKASRVCAPAYRPDDLSWYANIPVPTSYMCMGSSRDFVGGYDFKARAGLVHVANHHISPGKKQWTWGNHEFGYRWDRNLTEAGPDGVFRPYIELMAGVYTDNQPDFSFLQPGETKSWSQYWYPIREIGPAMEANVDAALSLRIEGRFARVGVAVTSHRTNLEIEVRAGGKIVKKTLAGVSPAQPQRLRLAIPAGSARQGLDITLRSRDGATILEYRRTVRRKTSAPPPAVEPPPPGDVVSADELLLIGQHLEQYRHATRLPEAYWREALRRDPGDARCNLAMGRWHLRRGEFKAAETFLLASVRRLTERNPNPYDGEAHYQLGICRRHLYFSTLANGGAPDTALLEQAYAALYKATWNHAWQSAAFHALAEIDCLRAEWNTALAHLERALRLNADNLRAVALKAIVLRKLGRGVEAKRLIADARRIDPLDWWLAHLAGEKLGCDNQVRLDLAFDAARAGLFDGALAILAGATTAPRGSYSASSGTEPVIHYTRAWLRALQVHRSDAKSRELRALAARDLRRAAQARPDFCFPARLEEIAVLSHAMRVSPGDARAPFYLGNLYYDRRRHDEAVSCWEKSVRLDPSNATAWRNLGIGYYIVQHRPVRARRAFDRALREEPGSARILFERDQLWKRIGETPGRRLAALEKSRALVGQRDDLSLEFAALCNQTGRHAEALEVLRSRRFQPWEGGEGKVLGEFVRTVLALGRQALADRQAEQAIAWFSAALTPPENLGEARHLLANASDVHYWLGCAHAANGEPDAARRHWKVAASFKRDFQSMSVRTYSEMSFYSALSLQRLGRKEEARRLLRAIAAYSRELAKTPAVIDYFATSLPTLLLFADDLQFRQTTTARLLEAQALLGLGRAAEGRERLREMLRHDPNHALAADLLDADPRRSPSP